MLYDVIGYDNQILGQVEAVDTTDVWQKAKQYKNVLDVRLIETEIPPIPFHSNECGKQCRPLFEKAARDNYEASGEVAGGSLAKAQLALYGCKEIEADFDIAFGEAERWFSFFGLWWSARLIEQNRREEALVILRDQEESYREDRAFALGIMQDYGATNTAELHSLTKYAFSSLDEGRVTEAISYADKAADLQYSLAVERTGTVAPGPRA